MNQDDWSTGTSWFYQRIVGMAGISPLAAGWLLAVWAILLTWGLTRSYLRETPVSEFVFFYLAMLLATAAEFVDPGHERIMVIARGAALLVAIIGIVLTLL